MNLKHLTRYKNHILIKAYYFVLKFINCSQYNYYIYTCVCVTTGIIYDFFFSKAFYDLTKSIKLNIGFGVLVLSLQINCFNHIRTQRPVVCSINIVSLLVCNPVNR